MEHFRNAKVVRLLSRHVKYLTADDDDEDCVRQHRNGASREAKWEVEVVEGRTGVIRLKSYCFNRYLAASDKRFLLGATGKKVLLLPLPPKAQPESLGECVEWQPIPDGHRCVKLRTKAGTFLRANGFIKPYGNTVTHGNPHRTVTQDWVLWEVDVVDMVHNPTTDSSPTAADGVIVQPSLSFSSYPASAVVPLGSIEECQSAQVSATKTKVLGAVASVTARSHAPTKSDVSVGSSCVSMDDDETGYTPSSRSSSVDYPARHTRLSAVSSEDISTFPTKPATRSSRRSSSTVSSSPPPSPRPPRPVRIPSPPSSPGRRATVSSSPHTSAVPPPPVRIPTPPSSPNSSSTVSSSPPTSAGGPPPPRRIHRPPPHIVSRPALSRRKVSLEGRQVHYFFADDDGEVDDNFGGGCFEFHGSTAKELINHVEKATGVDNFILCTRSVIDDKLYKLSLVLPLTPNRAPMTVFIVHPNSKVAKRFA